MSVYDFVFDRLRAVRQDMVIQGIVGADAIDILEKIVRFHLYASYRYNCFFNNLVTSIKAIVIDLPVWYLSLFHFRIIIL